MMTIQERLRYGVELLAEIEQKRQEQDNLGLFWAVEQRVIARELNELERQFLPTPVVVSRGKNRWVKGN